MAGIPRVVVSGFVVCMKMLGGIGCLEQLVCLGNGEVVREVFVRTASAMSGAVVWACCALTRVPCESWEAFAKSSCTIAETLV